MFHKIQLSDRLQRPPVQTRAAIPGSFMLMAALAVLLGACVAVDIASQPSSTILGNGDQVQFPHASTSVLTSTATVTFFPQVESNTSLQDAPPDLSDLEIYMEKTACEGPCPVYSVSVQGDGTVRYNGKTCVNVIGEQSDQISQTEVQELVEAFSQNDFFSLEDAYVEDIQDIPSVLIRFTLDDQTKQVFTRVYDPTRVPEAFTRTEETIDSVANTQQWVTLDGTPAPCP